MGGGDVGEGERNRLQIFDDQIRFTLGRAFLFSQNLDDGDLPAIGELWVSPVEVPTTRATRVSVAVRPVAHRLGHLALQRRELACVGRRWRFWFRGIVRFDQGEAQIFFRPRLQVSVGLAKDTGIIPPIERVHFDSGALLFEYDESLVFRSIDSRSAVQVVPIGLVVVGRGAIQATRRVDAQTASACVVEAATVSRRRLNNVVVGHPVEHELKLIAVLPDVFGRSGCHGSTDRPNHPQRNVNLSDGGGTVALSESDADHFRRRGQQIGSVRLGPLPADFDAPPGVDGFVSCPASIQFHFDVGFGVDDPQHRLNPHFGIVGHFQQFEPRHHERFGAVDFSSGIADKVHPRGKIAVYTPRPVIFQIAIVA